MRVFAALRPPSQALDHLQVAIDAVIPPWLGAGPSPLRWTDPEQRHVTLAFYGDVPDGAVDELTVGLADVAARWAPFEAQLAGAGVFSGATLWAGVHVVGPMVGAPRGRADAPADRTDADDHRSERDDADEAEDPRTDRVGRDLVALMAQCEAAGEGISRLEPRDRRRAHLTLARLGRRGAGRARGGRRGGRGRPPWAGDTGRPVGIGASGERDLWDDDGPGRRGVGHPVRDASGHGGDRGSDWRRAGGAFRPGPARTGRSRDEPVRPGEVDLDAVVHALSVYRGPVWTASQIVLIASVLGEGRGGGPRHEVLTTLPLGGP